MMMLCDSVQVSDGKLYILGGGWAFTGPEPGPFGMAMKLDVEWNEAPLPHHWELFLEDADGQPVMFETPQGTQPMELRGEFSLGQPEGIPEGSPLPLSLCFNFGPLPLEPGSRFVWRLMVDGDSIPGGSVDFNTRPRVEPVAE
jgi:hypothetical protein